MPRVKGTGIVIGENIRIRRQQLGLSERELGYRVGADGQYVRRWERGIKPSVDYLHALARELGVSMEDLLAEAPDTGAAA